LRSKLWTPFFFSALSALSACARAPDAATPLASVPFLYEHGLVYVEVAVGGDRSLLALLDTGANASAIDPDRATALPSLGESDVLGTTGSLRAENVSLTGLSLGAFELPELRARGARSAACSDHPAAGWN
jgi:hypothetical protein